MLSRTLSALGLVLVLPALMADAGCQQGEAAAQAGDQRPAASSPNRTEFIQNLNDADKAFRARDWTKATALYQAHLSASPASGRAWFNLGYSQHSLAKYREAIASYREAIERNHVPATSHYNIACAHAMLGEKDEAFIALQESISLGGVGEALLQRDTDLDSLRDDPRFTRLIEQESFATQGKPGAGDLDFLIGTWQVTLADRTSVGVNSITKTLQGYAIEEKWSAASGDQSRSLYTFDQAAGTWSQVAISDSGYVSQRRAEKVKDGVRFVGESRGPSGSVLRTRVTYVRLGDDMMSCKVEHSPENGAEFEATFEAIYTKRLPIRNN